MSSSMSTRTNSDTPYYRSVGKEVEAFETAHRLRLPVLLKGPTGCGKSRFVDHMASRLGLPIIKVACNEDTSASDLLGRFLLKSNETVWQDGPVSRAARSGALLYLDEIAEAREDVVVLLHSLTDYRRELYLDRTNETIQAPHSFQLVVSFNPGYQSHFKKLKPSTRQRMLTLEFRYPAQDIEKEIIKQESNADDRTCLRLVSLATKIRSMSELDLQETVSTRLLIYAASLIQAGLTPRLACEVGMFQSMTDEADSLSALNDLAALHF